MTPSVRDISFTIETGEIFGSSALPEREKARCRTFSPAFCPSVEGDIFYDDMSVREIKPSFSTGSASPSNIRICI
jgi:hypothetical protein